MTFNILLINPNTMKSPPVVPIGLEYLMTALRKNGYNAEILDLCFAVSPEKELKKHLQESSYDIIGITIRNIDSSLYYNNEFYLPAIKKLIQVIKKFDIPIVLGGSGFSAMPKEILDYLEGDFGIIGPGEVIFPEFLKAWTSKQINSRLFDGWQLGLDGDLIHLRGSNVNYSQYMSNGGIVGFRTHIGCQNHCPYCIEANKKIIPEKISNIIAELSYIVDKGFNHFHLCDSEFNNDLVHSINFCKALKESQIELKWTLYMKPTPFNEELIRLLNETNAYLITLTVDSDKHIQALNNYSYDDLAEFIRLCNKYGIQLVIDLLTGYPHEPFNSTKDVIKFFQKHRPTRVSVGYYYRLAKNTPLTKLITKEVAFHNKLTRPISNNENFLNPIFFSQYSQKRIEELIADDEIFSIAGLTPGVNYQYSEEKID
ncbi:MAG: B12-binding domain-containing radical SAM protein [Promethearchaeota archaeon]